MLKSMTGYGREQIVVDGYEIVVEIRAVNHRFYEFSARIPRAYVYLEEKLKSLLQGKIRRGKVEVAVSIRNSEGTDAQIAVNRQIAGGYIGALRDVQQEFGLSDDLALSHLLRLQDVFTVSKVQEDEERIWDMVSSAASVALDRFIAMREVEGQRMYADMQETSGRIRAQVQLVEAAFPKLVSDYRERLTVRMNEILSDNQVDEQRILFEAAIFADKIAIDEELVRLKSHLDQLESILEESEPVGRKLDFLVQEINREVNTIGSKVQDVEITRVVVALKSEVEKIREQLQNVE